MPMRFLASSKHDRHRTLSPVFTAISPPSAPWRASIATYRLSKQLASPVHRAPSPPGVRASRITRLSHAKMRFFESSKHDRHRTLSPVFTAISPPSAPWRASIATYRLCKQLASPVHCAPSPSGVRASRITRLSHANAILRVFRARSTPHRIASVHRHLLPPSTFWCASIATSRF
jgi:hypothetical protein